LTFGSSNLNSFRKFSCFKLYHWTHYLTDKSFTHDTYNMNWVKYLKFSYVENFWLINYLTFNYMFVYFFFQFDCVISFKYMSVMKLTLGKNLVVCYFFFLLFSAFLYGAFGRLWLSVRTRMGQSVWETVVRTHDLRVLYCSPCAACRIFFPWLEIIVLIFSRFLSRFWILFDF